MQKKAYTIIVIISILFYGCLDSKRTKTLGENEYYIGERLASISADEDSTFWIGGESGKVWHVDGDKVSAYITGTDRIYKIATRPNADGDTICWLGGRNSGLQEWRLYRGKMSHERTYDILFKNKEYSAYDFIITAKGIFTATSQGLYLLRSDKSFSLLYPALDSPTAKAGMPYIIYNLCPYGRDYLFAASINGLLRINLQSGSISLLHKGENIQYVTVFGNEVCVLSGKRIYIEDVWGKSVRTVDLSFVPRFYYRVGNVHYILRSHSMVISEDLRHFITIPLRRDFPKGCHNVLLPDYRSETSIFVTDNAFWRIPFHSGYFNNNGIVVSACANSREAYYLNSQNEVFRQPAGDSVAVKVYSLPKEEQVTEMVVTDSRRLIYVNDRSDLRAVDISGNNLRNEVLSNIRTLYHSDKKVTALHLEEKGREDRIYLGVQDGLVVIDRNGVAGSVKGMEDKYITSFFSSSGMDGIYMGTMDDGILYADKGRYFTIPGSKRLTFIRDLFVSGGYQPALTVLTNHTLVRPSRQDTLSLNGYNRLIPVDDSLFYAFPEFGVQKYAIMNGKMKYIGYYFKDIRFNAKASFCIGRTLYLVSEIGVLKLKTEEKKAPEYVAFDTNVGSIRMVLFVCLVVLALTGISFWMHTRRRQEQKRQIRLRISDLKERTLGMETMAALLSEDEQEQIRQLMEDIYMLEAGTGQTSKQISMLSERIMYKNRDMALLLSKMLKKQIGELQHIEAYDCIKMLEKSETALAQDKVSEIGERVMKNGLWLEQYRKFIDNVRKYRSVVDDCLIIRYVNGMMERHVEVLCNALRHRPMVEMKEDMEKAEADYNHIFTDETLLRLTDALRHFRERVSKLPVDGVSTALLESITKLETVAATLPRLEMLHVMKRVEAELSQLEIRQQLMEEMECYRRMREEVVQEYGEGGHRRMDVRLEVKISDYTQDVISRIDKLIIRLYDDFLFTDKEVFEHVLNFTNFTNQQARVLALLIANPKVKRVLLPGMLGMYGNLNPVISRLVNNKIKPNEGWLQAYVEKHPAGIVAYILRLTE